MQHHLHFHTFPHLGQNQSLWVACRKFTHCYLVTTYKLLLPLPRLNCWPETFSMHFLPKDKCKFSLKRKAIFTHTHISRLFLLPSLITVFTCMSGQNQSVEITEGTTSKTPCLKQNVKRQDCFVLFSSPSCFLTTCQDLAQAWILTAIQKAPNHRLAAKASDQPPTLSPCLCVSLSLIRTG